MARPASSSPASASRHAGSLELEREPGQRVSEHVVHLPGQPLPLGQAGRPRLGGPGSLQLGQQPVGLRVGVPQPVREQEHPEEAGDRERVEQHPKRRADPGDLGEQHHEDGARDVQRDLQPLRHLPGKLLLVWDRSQTHRGRVVREFVARQRGRIELEYLPAYAPELNPVEYIWGYWKHHELPNFCPHDFSQLSYQARRTLRRMRRRPTLVMAFWEQADLFPL